MLYTHPTSSYFIVHDSDTWIYKVLRSLASFKFRELL